MKRWPLFAAIAYAVILIAGLLLVPAAPEVSASGRELVRYYLDHGDGVRAAMWLGAWSMVPMVLLVAHLRSRVVGLGRDVLFLGATGVIVTTVIWSWFNLGLALHPKTLDPTVARTVADVSSYFGPVLTVSIVLLIVPVGLAAWRGEGGLPRWLAWVTLVFALEQSIETITVFGRRGFIAPGGAMNFTLGAGLFIVWVVSAGAASSTSRVPSMPTDIVTP
jgi:hypothetical protein